MAEMMDTTEAVGRKSKARNRWWARSEGSAEIPAVGQGCWYDFCKPLEAYLATPRTWLELREWATSTGHPRYVVRHMLAWLEDNKRAVAVKAQPVASSDESENRPDADELSEKVERADDERDLTAWLWMVVDAVQS